MSKGLDLDLLLDSDSLTFKQKMYLRGILDYEIGRDVRGEVLVRYLYKPSDMTLSYYPDLKNTQCRDNTYKHVMYSLIELSYGHIPDKALSNEVRLFIIANVAQHKYEQPLKAKSQAIYSLLERIIAYVK